MTRNRSVNLIQTTGKFWRIVWQERDQLDRQ